MTPAPTLSRVPHTPPSTPPIARSKSRAGHHPAKAPSDHWWSQVFSMGRASTAMSEPPRDSVCYGPHLENLNLAPEEHEIFSVGFDNDLTLRMFRNESTGDAKVVCTKGGLGGSYSSGRKNGYRFQTVMNAAGLNVARVGPGIHLMRRNLTWACLYFADFETMTLFYHAFLALRYNSPNAPRTKESEYWLNGESLVFSANIDDDGYTHALRLLRDKDSGCVRLAAAKADGDDDATIWTSFITNQICTPNWLYYRDSRSKTVMVRNIRQFSFSSFFETSMKREFELRFQQASDAHAFTQLMNYESRKIALAAQQRADYRRPRTPAPSSPAEGYF